MKRKLEDNQHPSKKIVKDYDRCCCLLDLNYSSKLLSSKIADIPQKLKYETCLAPMFEYCFGTSDQDKIWEDEDMVIKEYDFELKLLYLRIDWTRDETFIFSHMFNLSDINFITCARRFGFFNNRKFILNALDYFRGNSVFSQCNPLFRSDFEIMMTAVKEQGKFLKSASVKLKNNREIVKQAVKQDGDILSSVSKKWLDDKEIVMFALESSSHPGSYIFQFVSLRLKNDRDVVLTAVLHGLSFSDIDKSFNNDREVLLMVAKINGNETLKFACSELKKDKEIVLQAIQQNPDSFYYASDELKNDREFVKEIVKKYGKCLGFASKKFRNDKEIVELALKSYPDAIYSISLRKNIERISNIIGEREFETLPKGFSNDREIVLESIKLNPSNLTRASMDLQNDREFILQVVKNCGMSYEFIKEELKSDREIILEAITQNGDVIKSIPSKYWNDEELIIKATQTATDININYLFNSLPHRVKSDREFLKKCGLVFRRIPRKYQLDREIMIECLNKHPDLVLKYSYPLIVFERVLAMKIVKRNGLLLGKLPFKYRNDREIVSFAIQQNKKAFKFASYELKNDLEILKLKTLHNQESPRRPQVRSRPRPRQPPLN